MIHLTEVGHLLGAAGNLSPSVAVSFQLEPGLISTLRLAGAPLRTRVLVGSGQGLEILEIESCWSFLCPTTTYLIAVLR